MQAVNIVTVRSGWILQKIANRIAIAGNNRPDCIEWQVTHNPALYADVNFYCDVQNCWPGSIPGSSMNIGLFTHIHADDPKTVNKNTLELDYIFHMASRYMNVFSKEFSYPTHRMNLMVPFESRGWQLKKPYIGIMQRGKYEGKGFHFMLDFVDKYPDVCRIFKWSFFGNDWGPVVEKMRKAQLLATHLPDDKLQYPKDYESAYNTIDYLLIPSKWEGGPISCLEAVSKGVDIITADVGWARTWADNIFKPGDLNGLKTILENLTCKKRERARRLNKIVSYERCAKQIIKAARVGKK